MLEPYTPAGRDAFDSLVAGVGALFGVKVDPARQRVMLTAGERLFVDITGMLRNSVGREVMSVFFDAIDPASGSIIKNAAGRSAPRDGRRDQPYERASVSCGAFSP